MIPKFNQSIFNLEISGIQARNYGGKGEGLPCPFSKIGKSNLIFGKDALILVIYGLHFSFKMQFLRVSRRKKQRFFLAKLFFLVFYTIVYQNDLIPRKLPCSKRLLVMRLEWASNVGWLPF